MWMNLHTLPEGKHMYTLYLSDNPDPDAPNDEVCLEEVDIVASAYATKDDIVAAWRATGGHLDYDPNLTLVAIGDESLSEFVWFADGWAKHGRTGW